MNPGFVEYDPAACFDDGSCLTEIVVGPCDNGAAQIEQWIISGHAGTTAGLMCQIYNGGNYITNNLTYLIQPTTSYQNWNAWSSVIGRDLIEFYSLADVETWFNVVGLYIFNTMSNTASATAGGPLVQWDPNLSLIDNINRFHDEAGLDERFLMSPGSTMVCP